jgi:uncharacterized protein (DUF433 family)
MMSPTASYLHLEPRPCSNYRQLFIKGRRIRVEVLYRETVGLEPRTPEEVARDFDVPLEAVLEAIHYCEHNEDLLRQDRQRERERDKAVPAPDQVSSVKTEHRPEE